MPARRRSESPARRRTAALAAAACALVTTGLLATPAAHAAETTAETADNSLTVDLAASTGAFRGGASGALYGIYDQGVPSDNLIAGMGLRTVDTKAQDGQQHPGSDALEIAAPLVRGSGGDVHIYMTDVYRNFPYERTSYAEYQGYLRAQVQQVLTSPYRDHVVFVPYNEPDGNWFSGMSGDSTIAERFAAEWKQTYDLIKGLDPAARIAGPNFSWYNPAAVRIFLTDCKANGCLPDVLTWHELGVPSGVRTNVAAYRELEKQVGIGPLPVNLNEYAARYQLTSPAQMVGWLSALEDTKVDGDLAYWNINGTLGDSTARQNVPNAQWWLYNWYSRLSGDTVRVTPSQGNADYTMQGLAALDTAKRQARIILGGGAPGRTDVVVKNVDPGLFGRTVHATVEQDRWSGMTGAAATPQRVLDTDLPVASDGTVTLPVTDGTDERVTLACDATGARAAGRIGTALRLCGTGDYLALPGGIVSGLTDYTISAWVNPAQNSTWSRVFDFGSGTDKNMFLTLNDGNELRFAITNSGAGNEQRLNATTTLPLNTWSHVAVTLSGSTATLYVNGQAVATNPNMTLRPADLGSTTQNYLGRSQYNDPSLNGSVDDFQIYDHALGAAEIGALSAGAAGAGDVADYRFDETGGATAVDSSGNGHDGTVVAVAQKPPATVAYQVILAPGGTGKLATQARSTVSGSDSPADATWTRGYEAETADVTGTGWAVNTEGSVSNTWGLTTSGNRDVSGIHTGATTAINFAVDVPRDGDYRLSVVAASDTHDTAVTGPTNAFVRVDGGPAREILLPVGYQWADWDHADTRLHLAAGKHTISLGTTGDGGAATIGSAAIDKIDLQLLDPAVSGATVYEAEQAQLDGARISYRPQGQSGAGAVQLGRDASATFWVSSTDDGYSDLTLRARDGGAEIRVNGLPVTTRDRRAPAGPWHDAVARVHLGAGINKVVVTGRGALDRLTVAPVPAGDPAVAAQTVTYQAEDGTLTGTAHVDSSYSRAAGGVVTGVGGGPANALTLTVRAPRAGTYAATVRFANAEQVAANHYNPDLETAPADISVNGGPTVHVNFANTFHWNQFWTLTIPLRLRGGGNTIKIIANPQYNYDGTTVGVVYSGIGVGAQLRSDTAPNLDQITLAPVQMSTRD